MTHFSIALTNLFRHFSPSLFLNYLTAVLKSDYSFLPVEVQIEPSAVCNLHCRMCHLDTTHQSDRFLTPVNLKKFLDQNPQIKKINFTGMGETLLNPHLKTLVRICTRRRIFLSLVTNLQLLTPDTANLLTSNFTHISISLESGIPTSYQSIRRGANYHKLISNLKNLIAANRRQKKPATIVFNVTLLKSTLSRPRHLLSIIDLAADHHLDQITFQNPHRPHLISSSEINRIYNLLRHHAASKSVNIRLPSTRLAPASCYYPWVYPFITASGHLLPCCLIPQFYYYSKSLTDYSLGNVFTTSLSRVWNNSCARRFRSSLRLSRQTPCIRCSKFTGTL